MEFVSASWLWLGLAAAIPLALHWLQRGSSREITFAASRWLGQHPQQRWRRLQLREKLLLLLRLLIIALLAIILARPMPAADDSGHQRILVDPALSPEAIEVFVETELAIDREPDSAYTLYWLDVPPRPFSDPAPHTWTDDRRWQTLRALAGHPALRNAQILLPAAAGHARDEGLKASPGWRWHQLENPAATIDSAPSVTVAGDQPLWLAPMLAQLGYDGETVPAVAQLDDPARIPADFTGWLIYAMPGDLPADVQTFVRNGGLLITDRRVELETRDASASALPVSGRGNAYRLHAIGRGSWLQYSANWDANDFIQDPNFPQDTWAQWRSADWQTQRAQRVRWSPKRVPVQEVAIDAETPGSLPMALWPLLVVLITLLAAERTLALYGGRNEQIQGGAA